MCAVASEYERRNLMLYLIALGFDTEHKGFRGLLHLVANNDFTSLTENNLSEISKRAAQDFGYSMPSFERSIVRLINAAWNSDNDALKSFCTFMPKGYPPTYNEVVTALIMTRRMALSFGDKALSSDLIDEVRGLSEERYSAQLENPRDFYEAYPEFAVPEHLQKLEKIALEQL